MTAPSGWPPAPGFDAALAETVALAADDVLLDDLLLRLRSGARRRSPATRGLGLP